MKIQKNRIINNLRKAVSTSTRRDAFPCLLGNHSGVVDAGNGKVYVRFSNGQVFSVFNNKVQHSYGSLVMVGYEINDPHNLRVLGFWDTYATPSQSGVIPHHESHEYPAPDTVWVNPDQIKYLLCLPNADPSLVITVYGGIVEQGENIIYVRNQTIDMTAYIPSAGARWALLQYDINGDITVKLGGYYSESNKLNIDNIPKADDGYYRLSALITFYSQTAFYRNINGINHFVDFRFTSTGIDEQEITIENKRMKENMHMINSMNIHNNTVYQNTNFI